MRTLFLHCGLLLNGYTTDTIRENLPWPCEPQRVMWCCFIAGMVQSYIFMCLSQVGWFHATFFPYRLRLEQAQITKQVVWQSHVFHFGLKAVHRKQIWQNYNGKSETYPPGISWTQEIFKDEFLTKQCSSAQRLAVDFNSFQQNCCRHAEAGDFKATKPEGSLDEYLNRGQGFISCLRPTWAFQLPCSHSYLPPLRHQSQCVSLWGYKHIKE